jgi:hypothetical protein
MPDSYDGLVLTVANGDLPDADTSYFYFDLAKDGFCLFTLDLVIQNTTVTIEGSLDKPDISNASATWRDITSVIIGGATSITATGSVTASFPLKWPRLRVKRLTTNATNALQIRLFRGVF